MLTNSAIFTAGKHIVGPVVFYCHYKPLNGFIHYIVSYVTNTHFHSKGKSVSSTYNNWIVSAQRKKTFISVMLWLIEQKYAFRWILLKKLHTVEFKIFKIGQF